MRRIQVAALAGLLLLIAWSVYAEQADVDLTLTYHCYAVKKNPTDVFTFPAAASLPASNSSGENCGVYWSDKMAFVVYANGEGCIDFTTNGFVYQIAPGVPENPAIHILSAALDYTSCNAVYGVTWGWEGGGTGHPPSMVGGKLELNIQIGVQRKGYADMAGTYVALINADCWSCISGP